MENGEYRQLNDSLLQIENEFYSTIRPKRPAQSGETALTALHERGIEYVEVRCIDVSPFHPLGIDANTMRFVDAFILHCLMAPSPPCDEEEQELQRRNRGRVVNRGREPGLAIESRDGPRDLIEWASELLDEIGTKTELLDSAHGGHAYADALGVQRRKLAGEEELPSARLLRELREDRIPFSRLALKYSQRWAEHFLERPLDEGVERQLEAEGRDSLARQRAVEAADDQSFEDYLRTYYEQYKTIRAEI